MRFSPTQLLLAATISLAACASGKPASSTATQVLKPKENLITEVEIDGLPNVRDALQIVQRLRPTWITKSQSEGMTLSGTSMRGSVGSSSRGGLILVYLDNARVGTLKSLADIPINVISTIEFMDAATATALLPGLTSYTIAGAIVVHTRAGR